jgi:hypothetical protein
MTIETGLKNLEETRRITETVTWMKQFWELPPDAPNPEVMEQIAVSFVTKYS